MKPKKIRKSITEKEFKILIAHTKGDESLKDFNKVKLLRIFTLLFYTGIRINEISQITVRHIKEILEKGETIIFSHKTKNERILYFSEKSMKDIAKYFDTTADESNYVVCSWGNPKTQLHPISIISTVNNYMKKVLGEGFTSHSFRQGLLTEMGARSINPKIIQSFINHSDVKTTLRYIKPTENDVKMSLIR